ncbi:glycosyltransferase family 2 protein [Chryseobacterium carnipullorum]|uniref:Glycosyltransferase family 2 protein n=1 Tax=Chryseobacterium carnipullorum TaxID=1124835 RepID=A0A376EJ82_CHRCU|nr:glycosyltransferase family 2 protein [Chryseobacterium carnipullorum]MDN5422296.1 glycosyltransferase [Chryseobacterium sp.]AZA47482.1 glycosyltransferase family 2 protein [Chryseobacterium carnipullorum]AZA66818.1 glycosyltransferase family 2 protein [Chryseobacterium carnipullorum]MDN5477046.1 glycosyltransferase [Chryseobacterium sp.]STD10143.1 Hyaluronan synthase [Chryseobacterium carnipullorum]
MSNTVISVIVACYNQEQFLDECLQSVLEQTYPYWECIIVNDGSTDDTEKTAEKWIKKDPRFRYIYKENGGISSARNAGLEKSSGDYIQFLDSDDTIDREKFTKSLAGDKEYPLIISQFTIYKNNTHYKGYNHIEKAFVSFENIVFGWNLKFTIPIHCALISTKLLEGFIFDTTLSINEDWLMWIYITKNNPEVRLIDEPLAHYRKEDNKKSLSSDPYKVLRQRTTVLPILKKLYGDDLHDRLAYHMIEVHITQLSQLKHEFNKVTGGKVVSGYLAFKRYYYKFFQKKN